MEIVFVHMEKQKSFLMFIVAVILVASGIALLVMGPVLFEHLRKQINLHNKEVYNAWKRFPLDIPTNIYYFNWTNPEDIYKNNTKPTFKEMGPYKFHEINTKTDIEWNENGTVTYKHLRWWFTDSDNVDDLVTTINPVALSAATAIGKYNYIMRKAASLPFQKLVSDIHITRSVREMTFDGYQDILIDLVKRIPFLDKENLPQWDKFAWMYTRNGSEYYDGTFNTGIGDNNDMGVIYNWNYNNHTSFYPGECGRIKGSAGQFFPPNLKKTTTSFFFPDLCRSLVIDYSEEATVNNILGYKYILSTSVLDNGTLVPENKCFCDDQCLPSGILNLTSCKFGSPSFGSLPHFYKADPYYNNLIEGLEPNKQKHEAIVILEPVTGLPLEITARLQINLYLKPIPELSLYEDVPTVLFPVLWLEQKIRIPDDAAFKLYLLLNLPFISCLLGIISIFVGILIIIYSMHTRKVKFCFRGKIKQKDYFSEQIVPLKGS